MWTFERENTLEKKMNSGATLTCLFACITFLQQGCYGLTLTQEEIHVWVPAAAPIGTAVTVISFTTDPGEDNSTKEDDVSLHHQLIHYRLENVDGPFAIHPTEGTLYVRESLQRFLKSKERRMLKLVILANTSLSSAAQRVSVTLIVVNNVHCNQPTKDWCFWNRQTSFQLRVFENRPSTVLGDVGPPWVESVCPDWEVRYSILTTTTTSTTTTTTTGENFLKFDSDFKQRLTSLGFLDREELELRPFNLSCNLLSKSHDNTTVQFHQDGILHVLDENDNAPQLQSAYQSRIHVYLKGKTLVPGHALPFKEKILVLDQDSRNVNRYQIDLVENEPRFRLEHQIWQLEGYTVIYVNPLLEDGSSLSISHPDGYRLTIVFEDVGLLPRYGNGSVVVNVTIYPGLPPEGEYHSESPLMSAPGGETSANASAAAHSPSALQSVPLTNLPLIRSACHHKRVTGPLILAFPSKAIKTVFSIEPDQEQSLIPFAITPSTGIVYVSEPHLLRKQPFVDSFTFEVTWQSTFADGTVVKNSTLLNVIMEDPDGTESNFTLTPVCDANVFCAEFRSQLECESARGAVETSLTSMCTWKHKQSDIPAPTFTQQYTTCTASPDTCPDGTCDELEALYWGICPQDCTENVVGTGKLNSHWTPPRGIKTAVGVCSCDATGACSCAPESGPPVPESPSTFLTPRPGELQNGNDLAATKLPATPPALTLPTSDTIIGDEGSTSTFCDSTCLATVIGTCLGFFLLPAMLCVALWIRRRRIFQRPRRKHVSRAVSLSAIPSDYIEDGPTNLSLPIANSNSLSRGSKWEIQREHLIMERTLGEGEFGKVIKATFGTTGLTVAVKMIKSETGNADSATELQDLLSEFALLKDVKHPNVIKLLGACTAPGGPFLLVLEYAEHGSLRSYLRRSRHIEVELHEDVNNSEYSVTPHDILSFAWQISKGMAYLSEMKLVHRDLAARNVLVAAQKICKISDFGLSRDVYEGDTYLKRSKGRVPVKWMALESLSDQIYTSKSDVWSFGVLLWELATLGASPYPGVTPERLYRLLKTGYRMERPDNCSQELYSIMVHCWEEEPSDRPTFTEIVQTLDRMLQAGAEYLDLNSLMVHNRTYFENGPLAQYNWEDEEEENDAEEEDNRGKSDTDLQNLDDVIVQHSLTGTMSHLSPPPLPPRIPVVGRSQMKYSSSSTEAEDTPLIRERGSISLSPVHDKNPTNADLRSKKDQLRPSPPSTVVSLHVDLSDVALPDVGYLLPH